MNSAIILFCSRWIEKQPPRSGSAAVAKHCSSRSRTLFFLSNNSDFENIMVLFIRNIQRIQTHSLFMGLVQLSLVMVPFPVPPHPTQATKTKPYRCDIFTNLLLSTIHYCKTNLRKVVTAPTRTPDWSTYVMFRYSAPFNYKVRSWSSCVTTGRSTCPHSNTKL